MLKKILNEARITFYIEATGPILIKDGETNDERNARKQRDGQNSPDMRFVVDANNKIFIPGSSLRGVWRSWCEKIVRTISDNVPLACDPFDNSNGSINISCSEKLKGEKPLQVYSSSCPICKLFGNTSQASRLRISDAYGPPVDREKLPVRDGIGIDRFTGGASSGAKFQYQYLIGETFKTEVQIRNFELWQLGLLGYLFRDFKEELVPIGFGKTRGLGKVQGTVGRAELIFYGLQRPEDEDEKKVKISGIGTLYNGADKKNYGFDEKITPLEIKFTEASRTAIKTAIKISDTQAEALFTKAADYWACLGEDNKYSGYFLEAQARRNEMLEEKEDV